MPFFFTIFAPENKLFFVMETEERLMKMAVRYDLPLEFCQKLYNKLTDKIYYERAVRMFVDGSLKYSDAISDDSLDCKALRHEVAHNLVELRKKRDAALEHQKRVSEYYFKDCAKFALDYKSKRFFVFADKDTRTLSAIALVNLNSKEVKFVYANNAFEKFGEESLHGCLLEMRRLNKSFVRRLKKTCLNEPATTFKFDERTIRVKQ